MADKEMMVCPRGIGSPEIRCPDYGTQNHCKEHERSHFCEIPCPKGKVLCISTKQVGVPYVPSGQPEQQGEPDKLRDSIKRIICQEIIGCSAPDYRNFCTESEECPKANNGITKIIVLLKQIVEG